MNCWQVSFECLARISNQKAILHIESSWGCCSKTKPSIIEGFSVLLYTMHLVLGNHGQYSMNTNEKSTTPVLTKKKLHLWRLEE